MSAVISECGKYRYRLTREFADLGAIGERGSCCFIMLNPSTADAMNDDPTIRRCIGYAKRFECLRLEVVNLFAYRSTNPDALYAMSKDTAIGAENDRHILTVCHESKIIICAWGNHGELFGRGKDVLSMIKSHNFMRPMALKVNGKSKQPAHPLYLKANLTPIAMP